jgi:hypothetical protein
MAFLLKKNPSFASISAGHTLAWSSQALSGLLGVSGRQVSPAAGHPGAPWGTLGHPGAPEA